MSESEVELAIASAIYILLIKKRKKKKKRRWTTPFFNRKVIKTRTFSYIIIL